MIPLTYEDFCRVLSIFRKGKTNLPKWQSYMLYINIYLFLVMILVMSRSSRSIDYYPSHKYKKIAKYNCLGFKSHEYHER